MLEKRRYSIVPSLGIVQATKGRTGYKREVLTVSNGPTEMVRVRHSVLRLVTTI